MAPLISDDVLSRVAVSAPVDQLGAAIRERYGDRVQRIGLYTVVPPPWRTRAGRSSFPISTTGAAASAAALALAFLPAAALGQSESPCEELLPDVEWTVVVEAGPATIRGSDLGVALVERYQRELQPTLEAVAADLGGLEGSEVCLFNDKLPLDAQALGYPEGQILRAAAFGEEQAVVLSAIDRNLVTPAGILGLTYVAQWQQSGGTYPEPLGESVRQWYRSSAAGSLSSDRDAMRFANLTDRFDPIPWTEGTTPPLMLWQPRFQASPIGDFAAYVAHISGVEAFASPDADLLAELDDSWRQELLDEARGGRGPTTGWIIGLVVALGGVGAAVALAYAKYRSNRKSDRAGTA